MSLILDAAMQMRLSAQALAALVPAMSPRAAVQALLDAGLPGDALGLLARLLPHRYAVAWVCQCCRREVLDALDRAGLELAEAWVREPNEARRREALAFASAHRYRSIGAWVAACAGWTGGNLNPRDERPTPVPPHLSAIAAMAALSYLAARVAAQFDARRRGFVADAIGLLDGPERIDGGMQ
ncbi:Secreted protein [Pararobbsia alpina]|jgi:hypothetical protein|uniref:DUF6931 family protein n=1 Tax=Pararobbsia alpina TaxID=621374 RepID=UPI0039A69A27